MHDPAGVMFPHLETITPLLKSIFARVFVSVTRITRQALPEHVARLETDSFFYITYHEMDISVGEDFLTLYSNAAAHCHPNQVLHLCFIDRVAFTLQSSHQSAFIADVQAVQPEHTPLIFQRSTAAWNTHPQNYRELEQMVTRAGELLFQKSLDFAWCHLAIQAQQLQSVIPRVKHRDLSMFAEFVLLLRDAIHTKDVDWLAWEDPFIYGRDPRQLKAKREQSAAETRKRLSYVISMLKLLSASTY